MNKAELKAKWSKYCDTDKLADDMHELLTLYGHRNSEHGICTVLDTYFTNKAPLIELFATSKHYIGDMRIAMAKQFERQPDRNELYTFFCNNNKMFDEERLLRYVDEDGKKMADYLPTGKTFFRISELHETHGNEKLKKFSRHNGSLLVSQEACNSFHDYVSYFKNYAHSTMQHDFKTDYENSVLLKKGTKTSRAFNRVCCHYGIDKDENYNKVFAQYADLVSNLTREMNFIISLNPLDYLTMSFGVSWSSCHNIRSGGYMGGCLSYMLDCTSIITYVVDKMEEQIHRTPKYYRQMFHYSNNLFLQSRLYPQGNDGATNLYDMFRGYVTEEFNDMLHVNGGWDVSDKYYTDSLGQHYRDYAYNSSCRSFYPHEKANEAPTQVITIGHPSICVYCGKQLDYSNHLAHSNCTCRL